MSTTARINAATGAGAGITPDLAKTLHDNLGKTITAVIELRSESRGENLKGDETVNLSIHKLEVIPEDVGAAEHVREVAKAAYSNRVRAQDGPQLQLPGESPEPTVEEVTKAGARHRPHPYLTSGLAVDDNALCDVCGLLEAAPLHSTQDTLPDDPEHDEEGDDGADDQPDESTEPAELMDGDEDPEPWEYDAPEGTTPADADTVPSPFDIPSPDPDPAA